MAAYLLMVDTPISALSDGMCVCIFLRFSFIAYSSFTFAGNRDKINESEGRLCDREIGDLFLLKDRYI